MVAIQWINQHKGDLFSITENAILALLTITLAPIIILMLLFFSGLLGYQKNWIDLLFGSEAALAAGAEVLMTLMSRKSLDFLGKIGLAFAILIMVVFGGMFIKEVLDSAEIPTDKLPLSPVLLGAFSVVASSLYIGVAHFFDESKLKLTNMSVTERRMELGDE